MPTHVSRSTVRTQRAWAWRCAVLNLKCSFLHCHDSACLHFKPKSISMHLLAHEVFTYIDRVVADKASFLLWLDDCQKAKTTAETARARMVAHPLFPAFCEAIGVGVDQWGQDEANVAMELELFEEWVAAKDIEQRDPLKGLSEGTASFMDTMETQVDALWQLRACMASFRCLHRANANIISKLELRFPHHRRRRPCRRHLLRRLPLSMSHMLAQKMCRGRLQRQMPLPLQM